MHSHLVSFNFTNNSDDVTITFFPSITHYKHAGLLLIKYVAARHGHHLYGGTVPIHTAANDPTFTPLLLPTFSQVTVTGVAILSSGRRAGYGGCLYQFLRHPFFPPHTYRFRRTEPQAILRSLYDVFGNTCPDRSNSHFARPHKGSHFPTWRHSYLFVR